jgi:hypothetical protein
MFILCLKIISFWISTLLPLLWQVLVSVVLVKRVPGQGPEQRESGKTVLYALIIILFISYIIIKVLIKMRTISAETGKGTPMWVFYWILLKKC